MGMFTMKTAPGLAQVNGAELYFELAGTGDALVFVHGFSLDHRMWDDQFGVFAKHFKVVRYDLRGFGKSSLPGEARYSHAEDLLALVEHLKLGRVSVVGLSLGGGVAVDFALQFPEKIRSLIPVCPAIDGYPWSQEWNSSMEAIWKLGRSGDIEGARQLWLEHPLFKAVLSNASCGARFRALVMEYSGWHWANKNPLKRSDPPAFARLENIAAATCAIVGGLDQPDFRAAVDQLASRVAGANKAVLPGAGHMCNMEAPESFNQTVLDFLLGSRGLG